MPPTYIISSYSAVWNVNPVMYHALDDQLYRNTSVLCLAAHADVT